MSKNLYGIVAKIRDVRAKKRPEIEKHIEKIDKLLASISDTRKRASDVAKNNDDLTVALQSVSFDRAKDSLIKARNACEAALTRLSRESINIGVAAKAGQGKSQMLQMLTGLGNEQIPTGGGGACTAVRSIVHNSATKRAVVHYLTPEGLLEKKVYPSYKPAGSTQFALGLAGKPSTLEAFLSASLSEVEPADGLPTQGVNNWNDNVIPLQRDLNGTPELKQLLDRREEEVPMDDVRTFLVKDNNEKKHNVVDYVELWTPFEVGLPEGLTVYDLPGLEDPTPGIREDMLASVKSDADVVFFLLKPATNGERTLWKDEDNNATDMLQSVYRVEDVKPEDWIQLILNEDNREGHKNGGSINILLGKNPDGTASVPGTCKIPRGFVPVVCDCGSKDAVRKMVDDNIDRLVGQVARIDDLRIGQAEAEFSEALEAARALCDALRNASGDLIAHESGFDFRTHWEEFLAKLRLPFRSADRVSRFNGICKEVLSDYFKAARAKFKSIYAENEDLPRFPAELPVFSKTRIENLMGGQDVENAVNSAVRNQREAVLSFVRSELTECCDKLVERYFKEVISIGFDGNDALKLFCDRTGESCPREWFSRFLAALRQSGDNFPTVKSAVEELNKFNLTFEGTILPAIYSTGDIRDFDPDRSVCEDEGAEGVVRQLDMVKRHIIREIPVKDAQARAKYLFNWLKMKSEGIISAMTSGMDESAMTSIAKYAAAAMNANYDAFAYRFIWGDDCENEWYRLADRNKSVFWKDEFDKASAKSKLAKDWNAALSDFAAALRQENSL